MTSERALGKFQELNMSPAILNVTTLKKDAGTDIDFILIAS
jgi:hypothetical protein